MGYRVPPLGPGSPLAVSLLHRFTSVKFLEMPYSSFCTNWPWTTSINLLVHLYMNLTHHVIHGRILWSHPGFYSLEWLLFFSKGLHSEFKDGR